MGPKLPKGYLNEEFAVLSGGKMEELGDALKAVERELSLAKRIYRGTLFLYWAWSFPAIYLFSSILERYGGIHWGTATVVLSIIASIGFVLEERRAFRRILQLESVLGEKRGPSRGYLIAQVLVWPLSAAIATLYTGESGLWMLVFIGLGLLLLASVESVFTGSGDWRTALAGVILLGSTTMYTGTSYAVMVVGFAFSLTAYLHIKRATRE